MRAIVTTITPDIARQMLASSQGNRPLKRAKVQAYARDMASGRWCQNGETIIFDATGSLIDGHHRLTACVDAGATFSSIVVYDAPSDAQKTIDMGASRRAGDALGFYGYKNANHVNSIARVLMSIESGRARSVNPSTQEVFDFVEQNPGIIEATSFATARGRVIHGINSILGAIYFLEARSGNESQVERFADVLASGIPAYQGCAAHALRERLLKEEISRAKVSIADRQLLVLTAWEKFKAGAPVKTLKPKAAFTVVGYTKKEVA